MKIVSLFLLMIVFANAYLVTGVIERKNTKLDYSKLRISLNSGEYNGLVDNTGKFLVSVPYPGFYKLEVLNLQVHFDPVVVEVLEEEFAPNKNIKAFLFNLKTGKDYRLKYPLELEPSYRYQYFEERPPFDPFTYLKNPFVLMIGMSVLMSQMTKGMSKEDMKAA